jgi:hypothetical protein
MSILQNGAAVWQALLQSGLNPSTSSYDKSLEAELNSRLFSASIGSFEDNLASEDVSTERFLETFFGALQPFARMLRDTLAMFEAASARRSDQNLKMSFAFDNAATELVVTLQHFREIEELVRWTTRPALVRQWNSNLLFGLSNELREKNEAFGDI